MNLFRKTGWPTDLVIFVVTFIVYGPALFAGWLNFDDVIYVLQNSLITGPGGLYRIWLTMESNDYSPMTYSLFWLQWRLWGSNPFGYHLVNILLHAVNACLLCRVLRKIHIPAAAFAALIFAVHPVNVSSVAWIMELKNCLAMFFYAGTLLLYFKFEQNRRPAIYALSLLAFLLALLSKSAVVMLPVVLLLCSWWMRGRIDKRDAIRTVPFFALSLLFGLITIKFQYADIMSDAGLRDLSFLDRLAASGWVVWFYVGKVLVPIQLSMIYALRDIPAAWFVAFAPIVLLAAAMATCWFKRGSWGRPIGFALLYFVVTLFPILGFFDVTFFRFSIVSDHWLYFPIIGLIALAVSAGARLLANAGSAAPSAAGGIVVLVLSLMSWNRTHVFGSAEALWRDTLAKNPSAWLADNNLGNALAAKGEMPAAIQYYEEAIRLNPKYVSAHYNLGTTFYKVGRYADAIRSFETAIHLDPDYRDAYNNAGAACYQSGQYRRAVEFWQAALHRAPDWPEVLFNLAGIYATHPDETLRNGTEAVRLAERLYKLSGDTKTAIPERLAAAYAEAGRFDDAVRVAHHALTLAQSRGEQTLAAQIGQRIQSYEAGQPVRADK